MDARHRVTNLTRRSAFIGGAALSACASVNAAQVSAQQKLDEQFDALARAARVEGMGFIVLDESRRLYERFSGNITGARAIPLASATKWLTVALMMALIDDGVLRLDGAIGEYLPDAPITHQAITVRQLLSHTSGIEPQLALRLAPTLSLSEMAQAIMAAPLIAGPGDVFAYGGSSMQVAAHIAERRTGRDWRSLFLERLAGPLMLSSVAWSHPVAPGVRDGAPMVAGGLTLSPNDLATFLRVMLAWGTDGGRQIVSKASVVAIETLQTASVREFRRLDVADPSWRYGLGVWCERIEADGACSLTNSAGAFGTVPWIDRKAARAGVFAAQTRLPRVIAGALALRESSNTIL